MIVNYLRIHKPNLLILNPVSWGVIDLQKLKGDSGHSQLKCFALITGMVDESILKQYDNKVTVYDNVDNLKHKLEKLLDKSSHISPDDTGNLSAREKEILTCVVKGQTNKEIAESLFLSTHTVITHRRNIARKLEIHSTAGLTIYAIVNKLVELDDI